MNLLVNTLSPDATNMIRLDHTHVLSTFHRYKADTAPQTKKALVNTISMALEIHAQIEEEIFYPEIKRLMPNSEAVDKSVPEHNEMRRLIAALSVMEPTDPGYDDTVNELMRDVIHHVADEETILLPAAERELNSELSELGGQMMKRRLQLAAPKAGELATNMVRGMPGTTVMMLGAALGLGMLLAPRRRRRI